MSKTFKHSGNAGDVIYAIPAIRALAGSDEAVLYLQPNVIAHYSKGIVHPCGAYRMTEETVAALLPLLAEQEGITAASWSGQKMDYDLDRFRGVPFPFAAGDIARYYSLLWPVVPCTWKRWLTVKGYNFRDTVIVSRTARYQNHWIDYSVLRDEKLGFVGLKPEYQAFVTRFPKLAVEWIKTNDYLEAASVIAGCKYFVGNQSSCFALAEALKVKRCLEVCPYCPNVRPNGPNGYEAFTQAVFADVIKLLSGSGDTSLPQDVQPSRNGGRANSSSRGA